MSHGMPLEVAIKIRRLLREYLSPLVLCILFLAACGIPEMEIERTPTPDHAATATVDALATENARLTAQTATVAAPTPSPLPSRPMDTYTDLALVYHLDGTIYCGDFLGTEAVPKAMLPEPLPPEALWSARISGRFLAYVLRDRIMVTDLESGEIRTFHSIERPNVMVNFVWSSDGGALAYAASYDDLQAAFGSAVEVGVTDVEKGESQVVTTFTEWAGALVVGYNRASGEVWLIPRGQDPAFIEVHVYNVKQPGALPRVLAMSGHNLAVAAPDLSHLAVMDYDEEQALTKVYSLFDPTAPPVILRHPNGIFSAHYLWSQRHLAYVALEGAPWGEQTGGADGIWVWELEAKEPRRVAETRGKDDTLITWTPDGAWLLVRQMLSGGSPRYAVVPLEGGEPIPLPVPSWAQVLGWASTPPSTCEPAPSAPIPGPVATYIDAEIGCALDYPAEWHIQATPGWLVIITSFDPADAPGIGGVPSDRTKIDLAPDKPGQSKSLEELVAEVHTQARKPEVFEVLWEERWELAGGVPAVRMQVKGEAGVEMALLLTVINGRSLRLAGYGDTSLFDAIARTLRPIPTVMSAVPAWADDSGADIVEPLVPFRYGQVWSTQVPVYLTPGDPAQMVPLRHLLPPNTWVSIKEEIEMDQLVWYRIDEEEYVLISDVLPVSPSAFQGVAVGQTYHPPFGFVVADYLNVRVRPGVAPDNPPLDMLPRYTVVNILGQETTSDGVWYQIGSDRYVHSAYVRVVVTATPRPGDVAPDEKWVAVNLSEQTLVAYEGDRMVFATLVSTGLPWWRTPEGLFRIWVKLYAGKMSGGSVEANDYYYLEDVPWTMYFHRGYALHAAYWHDGFGYPRSRGCINLSPRDARWLFDWASPSLPEGRRAVLSEEDNPGTWVYVYSTTADLALAHVLPGAVP